MNWATLCILLSSMLFPIGSLAQENENIDIENPLNKGVEIFFDNLDSAIYYYKYGLNYFKIKEDWESYVGCYNGLVSGYFVSGDFPNSLKYSNLAIQNAKLHLGENSFAHSTALNNQACIFMARGKFDEALPIFYKALSIEQNLESKKEVFSIIGNIGRCYSGKGDIHESIQYFQNFINLPTNIKNEKIINLVGIYAELANNFIEINALDSALHIQQKGMKLLENPEIPQGDILTINKTNSHFLLAKIYSELGEKEDFFNQVKIAKDLEKKHQGAYSEMSFKLIGEWYLNHNSPIEAKTNFQKALPLVKKRYESFEFHPAIRSTYENIAQSQFLSKEFNESLQNYQEALKHFAQNNKYTDALLNPAIDSLYLTTDLLAVINGKAKALLAIYNQDTKTNSAYFEAANNTYELAIDLIRKLRQEFMAERSKEYLATSVLPIYQDAFEVKIAQYQAAPSPALLNEAFQLAEVGKAAILFESINENIAKGFGGIPDSVLNQEASLKREIALYQKNIYEEKGLQKVNAKKIANLEKNLFQIRRSHQELIAQLEKDFPDYYRLKYQKSPLASIASIQDELPDERCLLMEYFVTDTKIYLFNISKKWANVKVIDKSNKLSNWVESLRSLLHHPPNHQTAAQDFNQFTISAISLHDLLIRPATIPSNIDRLIIIPDDLLGYIPFEALLQKSIAKIPVNYGHSALEYMVQDFQISYNYSASLWTQSKNKKSTSLKNFLGFAPVFKTPGVSKTLTRDCTADELFRLKCNQEEVESIGHLINGRSLLGSDASKANFFATANEYKILHFATHSCLDDNNPMLNKIFLDDDYISNYDLYNIKLEAQLAVLSACNTGNGPLLKGEGVMSLFRGFLHAGCPSSLISFWSVEDCTTQGIMQDYYVALKKGSSKDLALQLAKKNYLENADRLYAHPFYWAPFVQFGSAAPLQLNSSWSLWFLAAGAAVLLVGLLIYFKRKS